MSAFRNAAAVAIALALLAPATRAELTVNVTANRNAVYVGESVMLTVEVRGAAGIEQPDLSHIADARITGRGSSDQSAISVVIGPNGRPDMQRQYGRNFVYDVTPLRTGDFTAGPVTVRAGNEVITAPGPRIAVMGIETQDWVRVSVSASRESVLVDEPFEIQLAVAIRQLPPPYTDHDPLVAQDPPRLSVPFLAGQSPDGLIGPNVQELLQAALVSRGDQPGLAVNDYTTRADPFDNPFDFQSFMQPRLARFRFPRRTVADRDGTYHVYTIKLNYTARKEGDYTFGPVEFKGQPITAVGPGGQVLTRPVMAVGPAVVVRVVPPPEEGRPDSYIGAIGSNLTVTATLDTQTCNVGDPLTLTLDLAGDISFDNLHAPRLNVQPALTRRFRVYEDTVQAQSRPGGKQYRYTIRPTEAGTYELPPIEVAYYDAPARAYRTVRSAPLPFRANETAQVGGGMILSASTNRMATRLAFRSTDAERLPAPITLNPAGAAPTRLWSWPLHGGLAATGPAVLALAGLARAGIRLRHRRAGSSRPRQARQAARAMLDAAARNATPAERRSAARRALATFAAQRLDAPGTGLTPAELRMLLTDACPPDVCDRYVAAYERLFHAEYAARSPADDPAADARAVRALIDELEAAVARRRPAGRATRGLASALALAATLAAPAANAQADTEHRFRWDQANARLMQAREPADFAAAAALYRQLILADVRNAPLFYNYGVALLEAGRPDDAARAFLRAERYAGRDPDIRRNFRVAAAAAASADRPPVVPWYREFLFWHYDLDLRTRLALALAGLSLLGASLALRLGQRPGAAARVHVAAVVLMITFGSSAAASWHAERRDQQREVARRDADLRVTPKPQEAAP